MNQKNITHNCEGTSMETDPEMTVIAELVEMNRLVETQNNLDLDNPSQTNLGMRRTLSGIYSRTDSV
jgi:hypothetical protein